MDDYNNLTEEEKKNYDIKNLGEGVELVGYNGEDGQVDLSQAFTKSSYKFDGIDDYVRIAYDGSRKVDVKDENGRVLESINEKEYLARNGFTFEFYGNIEKDEDTVDAHTTTDGWWWTGLFGSNDGVIDDSTDISRQCALEFMVSDNYMETGGILWRAGLETDIFSEKSDPRYTYNQIIYLTEEQKKKIFSSNDSFYFVVSLDTSRVYKEKNGESFYKYSIFLDNEKLGDFSYNVRSWDSFCNNGLKAMKAFVVGRIVDFNVFFSKIEAYSIRLYNSSLTDEQISSNYEKTIDYHNILESQ